MTQFWKPILLVVFSCVANFYAGKNVGYKDGYKDGYWKGHFTALADVHRQCDSPFPLLVVDEYFRCYPMYEYLNDEGAK